MGGHAPSTALRRLGADLGDLLAGHDQGRDLAEFERWAEDPVGFVREVLRGEPWSAQAEIAEALRDRPLVVVRSCNGAGKDWLAARLALWWCYARRGLVLVTGPTERQVVEIAMGELARAFRRARDLPGELYRTALRLGEEETTGVLSFTSTEASRLTGFHAPRVLAVLTEPRATRSSRGRGCWRAPRAPRTACSPGEPPAALRALLGRQPAGQRLERARDLGRRAPEPPGGPDRHPRGPEPAVRRADRRRRTRGTPAATGAASRASSRRRPRRACSRARGWTRPPSGGRPARARGARAIIAVNPARYGPDRTVLAVRRGDRLEAIVSWGTR